MTKQRNDTQLCNDTNGYVMAVKAIGYAMPLDCYAMPLDGYAMPLDGYAMTLDGYAMTLDGYSMTLDSYALDVITLDQRSMDTQSL